MAVDNSNIYDEIIYQTTVTWEDILFELYSASDDCDLKADFLGLPNEKQKELMDKYRFDIKKNLEYMGELTMENLSAACKDFVEEVKAIVEAIKQKDIELKEYYESQERIERAMNY